MLLEKIHLETDEKILKIVRKHWFVIFSELIGIGLMAILPIILLITFFNLPLPDQVDLSVDNLGSLLTFGISAWLLLCSMVGFMIWTHYYLDLWVITDRRLVIIDQVHFFNRNVKTLRLERLQDIEYYINGLIPTFLNFGTVKAQSAGAFEQNFSSYGLPDPRGLKAIIQQAMDTRISSIYQNNQVAADQG